MSDKKPASKQEMEKNHAVQLIRPKETLEMHIAPGEKEELSITVPPPPLIKKEVTPKQEITPKSQPTPKKK